MSLKIQESVHFGLEKTGNMDNHQQDANNLDREAQAYLSRIRRTISQSEAMISQAELRIAETDRFLEAQGLTRAQVEAMSFSDDQVDAVNAELKKRGLPELERLPDSPQAAPAKPNRPGTLEPDAADVNENLENRRRKFNTMMGSFRL